MSKERELPLVDVDRRLDELWERVDAGAARPRIQRHLDLLRQKEAVVRAAVEERYEESWQALGAFGRAVDQLFRLVEIELEIGAAAAAGALAPDAAAFADALASELAAWDLYLERLQVDAAAAPADERARAEDALRELRRHRAALARLLAEARAAPESWRGVRARAAAVRRELEQSVDETSTGLV